MDIEDSVRYPTTKSTTWYARINPVTPAMWGTRIEKAWAKSFSNYKALGRRGYSV
jgi:hypothetical protein